MLVIRIVVLLYRVSAYIYSLYKNIPLQMPHLSILILIFCSLIYFSECLLGYEVVQQMSYLNTISSGQKSLFIEAIHALDVNFASPLLVS